MEKRTILAIVLMAAVLAVSQYFFVSSPPEEEGAQPAPPTGSAPEAPAPEPPAPLSPPPAAARASVSRATAAYAAPGGGTVRVEAPLYELAIDRRGGVITRVYLERYPSFVDSLPVQLVPPPLAFLQRTIRAGERELDLTGIEFQPSQETVRIAERADSLVLTGSTPDGQPIRQVYLFEPGTYRIDYRLEAGAAALSGAELVTHLGPRLRSSEKSLEEDLGSFAAVARVQGEVHTYRPDDDDDLPATFRGSANWAGLKSKYFLGALISAEKPFDQVTIGGIPGDTLPGFDVAVSLPIEQGRAAYHVYLGPQEFRGLAAVGAGLEDVNQYGWSWIRWLIQPFAHVIVRILLWMHEVVPNYGVVLIIFGVLVRLLMWPLTQKSMESMLRMQAIQPEINRLRERYKNDPQRMQQELMKLYKERGVNPLGGCLPNLLPLPILFALFFVFQNTIEFRGAPFAFWVQDLSRPDPYYVLPVLMGLTMFIQQKVTVTGAAADNPQMKMMTYFMPAFLTFIFLNLASGLVLYYTVSNVLTFVQQFMIKRRSDRRNAAPAQA